MYKCINKVQMKTQADNPSIQKNGCKEIKLYILQTETNYVK